MSNVPPPVPPVDRPCFLISTQIFHMDFFSLKVFEAEQFTTATVLYFVTISSYPATQLPRSVQIFPVFTHIDLLGRGSGVAQPRHHPGPPGPGPP